MATVGYEGDSAREPLLLRVKTLNIPSVSLSGESPRFARSCRASRTEHGQWACERPARRPILQLVALKLAYLLLDLYLVAVSFASIEVEVFLVIRHCP